MLLGSRVRVKPEAGVNRRQEGVWLGQRQLVPEEGQEERSCGASQGPCEVLQGVGRGMTSSEAVKALPWVTLVVPAFP